MLLKKEINIGTLSDATVELDLLSVACYDYFKNPNMVEVRFEHGSDVNLYVGESVLVTNTIERNAMLTGTYNVDDSETYEIVSNDNLMKTFSIIADRYQRLVLGGISIEVYANILYINFSFDEWHFFRGWDTNAINFMVDFNGKTIVFTKCEYVSDTELRWRYDANLEGIDDFMCYVFRNDEYKCVGYADEDAEGLENYVVVDSIPETACFTDEVYLKRLIVFQKRPECIKWELYEKKCNDGTIFGLSAYRLNYKFKDINYVSVHVTVPVSSVSFPLLSADSCDLYMEQNIHEAFVLNQVGKAKNGIVEMEKLIYHPVSVLENGSGYNYTLLEEIKFNLHFRQREEDGWIVKEEGLWNGMGNYGLLGDVTSQNLEKFFSYASVDKGRQSDLLCYLGFNDSDVKYQKSRLKKSFLRLSFYDSPNRVNQNLLSYSTIFMNSGLLFSKMMTGAGRKNLYVISGSEDDVRYDNAKVNTEPCFEYGLNASDEQIEKFRLSSQVILGNRSSNYCSEGFYLYLWADNDNGAIPSDVYMRVDFNHAGFGRVVPMTMPYLDGTNNNHIYTMSEIAEIWEDSDDNTDRGWGIRSNEKFSYIHFKYVYNSELKKHVYYLDPDTYGFGAYHDNKLEINLYEPKIIFK